MKVFIIAGEASGDKLGAAMMDGFESLKTADIDFIGVGGPLMQERGLTSLFPMDEISLMGISEILSKYRFLKDRIRQTARAIIEAQPDVLITIDLPEFSFRVAKLVRQASSIPTVHYVAPTVWAWRPGRAKKISKYIDHVLALFPFEPPLMREAGMSCDFVGHPVVDDPIATRKEVEQFKSKFELGTGPILLCLPGSRHSEIKRLSPIFDATLQQVIGRRPEVNIVLPAAVPVADQVKTAVQNWKHKPVLIDPREYTPDQAIRIKKAAFKAADCAIAASGTVSLELAANHTPMVIAYDMNWLSRQIIGRLLRIDSVNLVNLVSESRAVPEFIGKACRPDRIASALLELMENPDKQNTAMERAMERLRVNANAPNNHAAQSVLNFLNR